MENLILIASLIIIMASMRVPTGLAKFNVYINEIVTFLTYEDPNTHIKNGIRLGMTLAELNQLTTLLQTWITAYAIHSNTQTKTKITRVTVVGFIKNFKLFFNPILRRIDASVACTNEDRTELNIAIRKPYSRKKVQIKEKPIDNAIQLGNGEIEIVCRTESEGKKGKIHPNATGWFLAYDIVDPKIDNPELSPKVKKVPPETAEECFNYVFYTRATDVVKLGAENKGREMVYFIRWFDARNPGLSGPYGPAKTIVIL